MPKMMEGMKAEDMMAMMSQMMPTMMEQCHAKMSAEEMGSMMHEMMPKMMEGCFSKMDTQQRQGMLGMCRDMLNQLEAKYQS
jgi:hypothetical protein